MHLDLVSQELKVSAASVCMVAAHVWDLIGAKSAGCLTALIARNGVAPLLLAGAPQPEVIGPDLTEVAVRLSGSIRRDSSDIGAASTGWDFAPETYAIESAVEIRKFST